jgi:predicted RND superfamily exporter protein
MPKAPTTDKQALDIRSKALNLPLFNGTLVSEDGKAIALYIPITSKNISYNVAELLKKHIAAYKGDEIYHITGMPVAQDVFGVEMFKQMAISAPMAMILIYLIMWYFFKKASFVISPMIVAMASVIVTMGLLVMTGNVIHIMSSMIPIFIMPIAVLDGVHILSDFYDRYPAIGDKRKTLEHVMKDLKKPMLFTTLTTAVGFGSLALTPIPPVQVFGIFVAIGVILAWIFTITLIPAYIMLLPPKSLYIHSQNGDSISDKALSGNGHMPLMSRFLNFLGTSTYHRAKTILVMVVLLSIGSVYGITKISVNDNPVKWFNAQHDIRVADKALNEKFAGTYMAYLNLTKQVSPQEELAFKKGLEQKFAAHSSPALQRLSLQIKAHKASPKSDYIHAVILSAETLMDNADGDDYDQLEATTEDLEALSQEAQYFKKPEVLRYMSALQNHLLTTGLVGKSNSLADVVKTVHREIFSGTAKDFRIPDHSDAVAQVLLTYQNSHRPQDLWHFVTPDYASTSLWLQLKSGDNRDMAKLVKEVTAYFKQHPAPEGLEHKWFGLTYINVIWQDKMVGGMAEAFIGSFILVLMMMTLLFRSVLWGILAMIPLAFTISVIYGVIGLIGKDYDMPVAVLSSLSLGLAVDYAIHFLARSREMRKNFSNWQETVQAMFKEPARAITRNVIVVGVGFMPLLAAPLVPYQTVGVFISAILVLAGIATLIILPALIRMLENSLFKGEKT